MKKKITLLISILLFIVFVITIYIIYNKSIKNTKTSTQKSSESKVINITINNYQNEIEEESLPVVLDFYASWCGPCKIISPIVEEIAKNYDGKIKVGKIDVDKQDTLSNKFKISSIPTIVILKDGNIIKTFIGVQDKKNITDEIDKII